MGHKKNKKEQNEDKQSQIQIAAVPNEAAENDAVRKPKKVKKKRVDATELIKEEPQGQNATEEKKEKRKKREKKVHFKNEINDGVKENPVGDKNEYLVLNDIVLQEKGSKNHEPQLENHFVNYNTFNDGEHFKVEDTVVAEQQENQNDQEQHQPLEQKPIEVKTEKSHKKKNNNVDEEKVIDWPEKDLSELFKRMEMAIPEKDTLAYSTRVEKLNWDDIAFKNFTGEECKSTWLLVQKRLRRFRLLNELLQDAKEWTSKPWTNFYGGQKTKRHPDMPRRPLSTYMLFYLHKKDNIIAENPGLEMTEISKIITQMYKALTPLKREKYTKEAAEKRKIYEMEIEEFYRQHPEIARNMEKNVPQKQIVEPGPKKPNTPFVLYYESQLKSVDPSIAIDKHTFKEQIKEQWKNMSDKKKVVWINWAADEETKYQDELKTYISQNPDFVPGTIKPVLTKEEKIIKERMAGKPMKPPNSAYSLFSRMMLQSDEIKEVNPKDRMMYIAEKWKNCTEEERKDYSERILHLREQYKLDFASYLESLPEDKRQEEIRSTLPKRKRTVSKTEEKELKKKKPEPESVDNNNVKTKKPGKNDEPRKNKKADEEKSETKEDQKSSPFARPKYWNRMKKEEKRTFKNAMLKLKEHLDSRFEKYISSRGSDTSEEDSDSEDSDGSSSSS